MFHVFLVEGPLGGEQMRIAARQLPELLCLAPAPGIPGAVVAGHILIGTDLSPPPHPWPGQLDYKLDPSASILSEHPEYPDMQQGMAIYGFVAP